MNARALFIIASLLAVGSAGCGSSGGGEGALDASVHDDAAEGRDAAGGIDAVEGVDADPNAPAVEIGTGETRFVAITENGPIDFTRGPQGGSRYYGFHIWSSVRAHNLNPSELSATFTVHTASTSVLLSESRYRLDLEHTNAGDVAFGLRMILDDCCNAEGQALVMRVVVRDADNKTAEDERTVMAPAECPRGLPNPTIDPCP